PSTRAASSPPPSGPAWARGEGVRLGRAGGGGGGGAACTVLDEPEAAVGAGGSPRVTVAIRVDRAFGRPLAPADLLGEPALRSLAFLDLHDATEVRLGPAQQEAFARAVAVRDATGVVEDEGETVMRVPRRLVPVVEELLARLGAHEPPPPVAATARPAGGATVAGPPPAPTDLQLEQAEEAAVAHGTRAFTIDEVAVTWRTGVGTARSRVERLVEVGLVARAGTRRPEDADGRPARGRPPVLYRLALAGAGTSEG
ncbi:MAG: hypothetical protein ACO3VG_05845, partial [Nitriliruptoraceae bacterium]